MLTLALLVLGVFTNHAQATLAADNFAIPANGFYGCSYFHVNICTPLFPWLNRTGLFPLSRGPRAGGGFY